MYKKNVNAPQLAKGWDTMYTNIKAFHGITTPCTSATACLNVVEGSAEHVLLVEKSKANWAKNAEAQSILETAKFAKGEGNFQLVAMRELKERGIECDDPTKATSILEVAKFAKGEGNFQLVAMRELKERGIECDDPTKAKSILEVAKFAKGEGNFQLVAMRELKERGIECDDPTKAKSILEVTKFAKGEGNFQLVAMRELKERGIECDDQTKAQCILNSINNPMKNPATVAKHKAKILGAGNGRYKGDKWSPGEVIQLRKLCKAQHSIMKIAEIMNCDVASKRTVHNKIFELQIRVKLSGKYQLLTKKCN
jgi:hypothetical protein